MSVVDEIELVLEAVTGEIGVDDGLVKSGTPPLPVAHGTVQLPPGYENGGVGVERVELELLAVTGEIGVVAGTVGK